MQIHISEIIAKAEEYYRRILPDGEYDEALHAIQESIIKFINKVQDDPDQQPVPVWEAVAYFLSRDNDDVHFKTFIVIAGFKIEQEKQSIKEDKEHWEAMVRIALSNLKEFYLPENATVEILTVDELVERYNKSQKQILKSSVQIFFLNSYVYYPVTFLFLIIKTCLIIILVIKPVYKSVKKTVYENGEQPNLIKITEVAISRLPRICDTKYWYHHIIIGILLWILLFLWILK